jgi:hypothetical protein
MAGLVLDGDMLVTQLSPHGYDLGDPFNCDVPFHNSCRIRPSAPILLRLPLIRELLGTRNAWAEPAAPARWDRWLKNMSMLVRKAACPPAGVTPCPSVTVKSL